MTEDIFLVWIVEGDNDMPVGPLTARKSEQGARDWCDRHQEASYGEPVQWRKNSPVGKWVRGSSVVDFPGKQPPFTRVYLIQKMKLED